jgi:hypothetical protein
MMSRSRLTARAGLVSSGRPIRECAHSFWPAVPVPVDAP